MPHSPLKDFSRLAALIVAIGASACTREASTNEANVSQPAEPATVDAAEDSPLPDLPLDRQGLLVAMLQSSTAAVLGADDARQQEALRGRRFELRMRFGCGHSKGGLNRRWTFDKASGALRVVVRPDIDQDVEKAEGEQESATHHERGFLAPNPTLLSAGCPSADYATVPATSSLRFGVVQRTDPQGARSRQLLESYEVTKKIAADQAPTQGLELVLRGRLETTSGGPIRCAPRGGMVECLALSTIDLVSIEDPSNGRLIAEWGQN